MLRMGNAKPESMNAGVEKKKLPIIACCCVCEMVERNRPAPSEAIRNNTTQKNSNRKLPCSGIWNTRSAIALKSTYNIKIINLSLGRPVMESYTLDPLCQAVEQAWKAIGMLIVVKIGRAH